MPPRKDPSKNESFDDFFAKFKADHTNVSTAQELGQIQSARRVYSTGIFTLDMAFGMVDPITGLPGFVEGSVIEVFGPFGTYKTGTLLQTVKSILTTTDKKVAILMPEEIRASRMTDMGIDADRVISIKIDWNDTTLREKSAEDTLIQLIQLVKRPEIALVAIDSLAALMCLSEQYEDNGKEKALDAATIANKARMMGRFLKFFRASTKGASLFVINQARAKIDANARFSKRAVGDTQRTYTPGGSALSFECDWRVEVQGKGEESETKGAINIADPTHKIYTSMSVLYKVEKSRSYDRTSGKTALANIDFTSKLPNNEETVLAWAEVADRNKPEDERLLTLEKKTYTIKGNRIVGDKNAVEYLRQNRDIYNELVANCARHRELYYFPSGKKGDEPTAEDMLA